MDLRKIAGLLAAGGLTVGLIGGGVGASFFDDVTAKQDISVGEFSCVISDGGGGLLGDFDAYGAHSVTYDPYVINSSEAGTDKLAYTVLNAGTISARLTVTSPTVTSPPFSIIGDPFATVDLAPGGTQVYNTGVQWTELDNSNLGQTGSLTWTVNCGEVPATPVTHAVRSAALNYGPTGWAGWSCDRGQIVSAAITDGTGFNVILWKPGATTGAVTYPNTPWGYVYDELAGEEGAIAQNLSNVGQVVHIDLVCTGL